MIAHWKTLKLGAVLLPICLADCVGGGESIGTTSSIVRTSIVPASVPYYLDLCGQSPDRTYRLFAPAALQDWENATYSPSAEKEEIQADRRKCTKARQIENGDPITVRLHRVGIGGLATFDGEGKCRKGCKRDVAIVLDFNGSMTLQKPIVAFYQTDVAPDSNLQFINQIIFAQNEWFYRYPPSVRVRLYDVRDDKDAALRNNLETIKKGASLISQYIAGAAIAGPIIDTAVNAADQLISAPRNRAIMDMSFQLFPDEQQEPEKTPPKPVSLSDIKVKQPVYEPSSKNLSESEVRRLQKSLGMSAADQDGKLGKRTFAALQGRDEIFNRLAPESGDFNKAVRTLFVVTSTTGELRPDATFGSPIYASQFIVFDEGARESGNCAAASTLTPRQRLGKPLPSYFFAPDGVRYGGARVYSNEGDKQCLLDASYVIFSITKESANVAADVAKRISDLQTKFTANQAVSEDALAALTSARVDAELALAIDRMENTRRADRLRAMLIKLSTLTKDGSATATADRTVPPLPGAQYRNRAYRLVEDYLGCPLNDQTTVEQLDSLATALGATEWQGVSRQSLTKPYFGADKLRLGLVCPEAAGTTTPGPVATPPPVDTPDDTEIGDTPVVQM